MPNAPARQKSTDPEARALAYVTINRPRILAELKDFIRFPSVSAQPHNAEDLRKCAHWLAAHLSRVGLEKVRVIETPGHPLVVAQWRREPVRPTLLIYGHYDVQPPDPIAEWCSPPFAPVIRGNELFGRGASDDKGQMFAHVKALEAYMRTIGKLPVNVVCIFEGEEEIGSPNLPRFLASSRKALAANVAILSDMPIPDPDRPAITYAMRGALSLELEVTRRGHDLHSGNFGGAIRNPLQGLCEIVARLHHVDGRIAIPGFYDGVGPVGGPERAALAASGPTDAQLLHNAGADQGWGEPGYTLVERTTIRPSLSINGLTGGYQGPGPKAVIPVKASAKLNFRLVSDQDPRDIERLFRAYVGQITPDGLRATVRTQLAARPIVLDRQGPAMRAAAAAYRTGFGTPPLFVRLGGTIPVVQHLREILGMPTVLMGFALPDDRMHAPNEKFHIPTFFNGIATSIAFLAEMGRSTGAQRPGRACARRAAEVWA